MPDTKISALTDGVSVQELDRLVVARSPFAAGDNRYLQPHAVQVRPLAPTVNETIPANYGAVVPRKLTIALGKIITIGLAARLRIL